ncbi:acyl carrier protein [Pseudomonas sp. NPDC087598]|uniref:acyl carrier protein n=1 Tax=Pseudomonas sp. NPDC087598 TaxID=3364440 RepID=UPI0037F41E1D
MMNNSVQKKVTDYICELSGIEHVEATDELFSSGRMNSLRALSLIQWIESTFNIVVDGSDISPANLCSIEAVSQFIDRKKAA